MRIPRLSLLLSAAAGACASLTPLVQAQGPEAPHAVSYAGHRSVRVTVATPRELMTVLALTDDVLTCEGAGIGTFDVRLSPEQFETFLRTGIQHHILIDDLGAHIDAWRAENERIRRDPARTAWYDAFRDLEEIETRITQLAAAHPGIATLSVVGQSLEGRPIRMLRITGPGPTQNRPGFVIHGAQHSRESLSPMTTMYFTEQLLTRYGADPRITAVVNSIDFHIVPVMNPDGYVTVWTSDPLWRKNRRINPGSTCRGVDLNRNWGYEWGHNNGSSGDPCSQTFRGAAAFSEPETQAIASIVDALSAQGRMKLHMDIHSYATQLLSPWGYTTQPPPHLYTMHHLARTMRDAIATHRGTTYQYGQGSVILYVVSGGSRDYSYGVHGAMGWTIELPGTSFHPPASEILPVAQETELGLLALSDAYLDSVPQGACCLPGDCAVLSRAQCDAVGGFFLGDDSTCAAACPARLTTGAANAGLPNNGGIFLNLTAAADRLVPRIDIYSNSAAGTPVSVQIWTYPGSYVGNDNNPSGWTLHETAEVSGSYGAGLPTPLLLTQPLALSAGQTRGIYLLAPSGGIRYTSAGAQLTWSDAHLTLYSNRARSAPWGGSLYQPRTFAGVIHHTAPPALCYANCDASTTAPILNVADFTCFLQKFAAGDAYANCDASTQPPVLNVADFTCFLQKFAAGCP